MTGYTVHTGASKKFVSGWDTVFGAEKKSGKKSAKKKRAVAKKKSGVKKKGKKKRSQ